jgi:ribosome-binding factor A
MERVNVLLRQEISKVLESELADPRLSSLVSITSVESASDMRRARVNISVLGDKDEKTKALTALNSASGYIHRTIKKRLALRAVPFLEFRLDETIERSAEMMAMIKMYSVGEASDDEEVRD